MFLLSLNILFGSGVSKATNEEEYTIPSITREYLGPVQLVEYCSGSIDLTT
jgi:hypothetical protein